MSEFVKRWQNLLIQRGFLKGRADGQFGPKTLAASLEAAEIEEETPLAVERVGDTQLIIDTCKQYGLLRNQTAYVLATAFWETNRTMKPVVEAYWLSEDWRKKNLRYYPWHGRGYVQLTWEYNYIRAAKEVDQPLDKDPSLALDPAIAARILVAGSMNGWFTGRKLRDFVNSNHSDFVGARRVINGTDKARAIAAIAQDYDDDLKTEGFA